MLFLISFIGWNTGTKTVVRTSGEKEAFSCKRKREKKNGYAEQGIYKYNSRMKYLEDFI